jgi:RNA polymerase sigma-70 factor (ECF subfamily)
MKGLVVSTLSLFSSRTDEESMCQVKAHDDHHEFTRLMKRWEAPIRRLCIRMTGDAHRGEDLTQETFLRLFEKRKNYEPTGRFSTFLWRIALNLCYDELRRQQRRREFLRDTDEQENEGENDSSEAISEGVGPDVRTAQLEEGELVRRALLQLPDIYRTVLVLRHYEDMKLARIAEVLEIPEGTVNSRMAEALTRLSRLLEPKLKTNPESRLQPARTGSAEPHHKQSSSAPEDPSSISNHKVPITDYSILQYEPS